MNERINTIKLENIFYSAFKFAFRKAIYDLTYELQHNTGIVNAPTIDKELLKIDLQLWNDLLMELEKGNNATLRIYRSNSDGQ